MTDWWRAVGFSSEDIFLLWGERLSVGRTMFEIRPFFP